MNWIPSVAAIGLSLGLTAPAFAQFAVPPDGEEPVIADDTIDDFSGFRQPRLPPPKSTARLHIGPALKVDENQADGGLGAALDVGRAGAGLRLSGLWAGTGTRGHHSQYGAELWLDFIDEGPFHPIVGAGAGVARLQVPDGAGNDQTTTVGVATLRLGLQYALPIRGTDARASIEAIGNLPAIHETDGPEVAPWATVLAAVGVGF